MKFLSERSVSVNVGWLILAAVVELAQIAIIANLLP